MKSKTTEVRQRKIDGVCQALTDLVYFISHYKKRDLKVIKHSELKEVLKNTTKWKTELIDYQKIAQKSNNASSDVDVRAEASEGIKK